jgi:aryl-alcohol dehydrogenase-like predicted oxidoreductase
VSKQQGIAPPCAAQLAYSLLNISPVEDATVSRLLTQTGIGVVASYSLHGGLLTGKYNQLAAVSGRFDAKAVGSMRQKKLLDKVERFIRVSREVGCTPAQLALAYCLKNPQVSSVLFGSTNVSQIQENLQTLEVLPHINQEVMAQLRELI